MGAIKGVKRGNYTKAHPKTDYVRVRLDERTRRRLEKMSGDSEPHSKMSEIIRDLINHHYHFLYGDVEDDENWGVSDEDYDEDGNYIGK